MGYQSQSMGACCAPCASKDTATPIAGYPGEAIFKPFEPAAAAVWDVYKKNPFAVVAGASAAIGLLYFTLRKRKP